MTPLAQVITVKLIVTVFFWAGPMIFAPAWLLEDAGLPYEAVPFARLLGIAYLALSVGYAFGLRDVLAGGRAWSMVTVGIVSNAGAGVYLIYLGMTDVWVGYHPLVPLAAWASAAITLSIALGLCWFGLRKKVG